MSHTIGDILQVILDDIYSARPVTSVPVPFDPATMHKLDAADDEIKRLVSIILSTSGEHNVIARRVQVTALNALPINPAEVDEQFTLRSQLDILTAVLSHAIRARYDVYHYATVGIAQLGDEVVVFREMETGAERIARQLAGINEEFGVGFEGLGKTGGGMVN
jgi:hypothetical protein